MPAPSSPRACHGRRTSLRAVAASVTGALVIVLTACTGDAPPPDEPALSTPLASYDTSTAVVERRAFCEQVGVDPLQEALGEVVEPTTWRDGDRVAVAGGRDRVQEYGCAWESDRASARAWVVAPPVTKELARELVAEEPEQGCRPVPRADEYGTPSRALICTDGTVRYAGLFGDAWLTCELTTPEPDPGLAGRWCVAVTTAASS